MKYTNFDSAVCAEKSRSGTAWRKMVLMAVVLSQSACTAAVLATGAADPFYSAVDAAAERRV